MIEALAASGREVPPYLEGLAPQEEIATAAFAMPCFWTGEYELEKIDLVVSTEAGWQEGHEVTLVRFLPATVDLPTLAKLAAAVQWTSHHQRSAVETLAAGCWFAALALTNRGSGQHPRRFSAPLFGYKMRWHQQLNLNPKHAGATPYPLNT